MTKKHFILVLGPQCSGKSTQAELLADYIGYKFISSGKLLRKLEREKNPIGLKLAEYWINGNLVPDELIDEVIFTTFEMEDAKGFVLDGYPRNITQFETFFSFLKLNGWPLLNAFYIKVGGEESRKRLLKRAELEHRLDETPEAIEKRLSIYHSETQPLLTRYDEMGILTKIDGERSIEDIQMDIQSRITTKE